jgi:DNA repair and recombination RAD54-like protein
MDDHAIVLWDPTIDDKPPPAEILSDEAAAELKRKREEEERGPHKSLKTILGIQEKGKKKETKVAVVIDPRLTKVLRPHQVEGVKVG